MVDEEQTRRVGIEIEAFGLTGKWRKIEEESFLFHQGTNFLKRVEFIILASNNVFTA
jgi:hypothetical protein